MWKVGVCHIRSWRVNIISSSFPKKGPTPDGLIPRGLIYQPSSPAWLQVLEEATRFLLQVRLQLTSWDPIYPFYFSFKSKITSHVSDVGWRRQEVTPKICSFLSIKWKLPSIWSRWIWQKATKKKIGGKLFLKELGCWFFLMYAFILFTKKSSKWPLGN